MIQPPNVITIETRRRAADRIAYEEDREAFAAPQCPVDGAADAQALICLRGARKEPFTPG